MQIIDKSRISCLSVEVALTSKQKTYHCHSSQLLSAHAHNEKNDPTLQALALAHYLLCPGIVGGSIWCVISQHAV